MNPPESSRWRRDQRYLYLLAKVILVIIVITGLLWFFEQLRDLLVNIGISFLIAYLLDPVVDWFEDKGVNRTLAIFILLVVGVGALAAFVLLIAPTLTDEIASLVTDTLPEALEGMRGRYKEASVYLEGRTGYALPKTFNETFTDYGQRLQELATEVVQRITSVTGQFLSASWAVVAYVVNILLVPLFVFYYLRDFNRIKSAVASLIPIPFRDKIINKAKRIDSVVGHWFRGQLTVCAVLGVLYALGLAILDVKLGIAIGILAGLLHIIPYLGFVVGILLALIMSAVDDGSGWGQFFGIIAVMVAVQTLEAYIITPKIVGERVGLSPLMVIIVVLIGGQLFGFWGVLLAVPAAGVIRVFLLDAMADYKRSRYFLGETNYIKLLADGPRGVGEDVRQALKQAAEADLDMDLPAPLTNEEIHRLSVAVMAGAHHRSDSGAFSLGAHMSKDALKRATEESAEPTAEAVDDDVISEPTEPPEP